MNWFRRAEPASSSWNLAKTAAQVVAFWGVLLFVVPAWLVSLSVRFGVAPVAIPGGRLLAVITFAAASALGLSSAATMAIRGQGTPLPLDAPRRLVQSGPYAWVRNPMALAGLAQGAAVACWHGSAVVAAYVLAGGLAWHFLARPLEEHDLAQAFGADFDRYRSRVPLWIPRRPSAD